MVFVAKASMPTPLPPPPPAGAQPDASWPVPQTPPPIPVGISIPEARVDARVIPVGVTDAGNLDVPPNFVEAGWYMSGTRPGDVGSAVIDGHVDTGGWVPMPGIFKHLRDLESRDIITVRMSDGTDVRFSVTESNVYDKNKFPGELIFHENDAAYLKIITCHGKWLPSENTYADRLVVTAVLVK
jgi:sortase (surface protein transpeptidase)